jgi:hypothetical protein
MERRNTKQQQLRNGEIQNYEMANNAISDIAVADTLPKYLPTTKWQKLQNGK